MPSTGERVIPVHPSYNMREVVSVYEGQMVKLNVTMQLEAGGPWVMAGKTVGPGKFDPAELKELLADGRAELVASPRQADKLAAKKAAAEAETEAIEIKKPKKRGRK